MATAYSSTPKEAVTAALLVIGGKILSGRTKDQNVGYIAEYLTAVGIDLKEVRVVGDEERAIIDALNALRHRCTYVFTTGGIGPTHGDITADCVGKAFGVPIDTDPRALAILHEWVKTTAAEMNEARLRMTRIPKGAELILNKVSGAPGFWIGNVNRDGGLPSIMQAMLDEVAPKLKIGVRMLSETVRADLAGEAEWRTTRTTPLAQPTPQELLPCAANQRAWCSRITATASAALSTQHGICHILGARQLESG